MLDELVRRREAADAEREEDPASGVRGLGGVVGQLLADLAVDLVPGKKSIRSVRRMSLLKFVLGTFSTCLHQRFHYTSSIDIFDQYCIYRLEVSPQYLMDNIIQILVLSIKCTQSE